MMNASPSQGFLTAPQFDEPDSELRSLKIELANTTNPARSAELCNLIKRRLKELERLR